MHIGAYRCRVCVGVYRGEVVPSADVYHLARPVNPASISVGWELERAAATARGFSFHDDKLLRVYGCVQMCIGVYRGMGCIGVYSRMRELLVSIASVIFCVPSYSKREIKR